MILEAVSLYLLLKIINHVGDWKGRICPFIKILNIFAEVAFWMHTGERQAAKMRMAYVRSMLNQDISLFDTEASTGEVISAITTDIIVVQDAISEKVTYLLLFFLHILLYLF